MLLKSDYLLLARSLVYEQLVLDVPELLREVNVVAVGVLEALDLLPEELDDRFPRRGLAEALLIPGRMNDTMYRPEIDPARLTGENNRRGYFFIRHALRKGDIATAEKMLAAMTEDPKMYRHTGIRLAAALVARAKGNEAAAREHERLGITQAAMQQYSYYNYHWTDAHRLLLEHGLTHASERLMLLIPERDLSYTRPALAQKLAEQRKFRSAAFAMELLLAKFCSNAVPVSGLGTQEDLISWRLQADVYKWRHVPEGGNPAFRFFTVEVVPPGCESSIVDEDDLGGVQLWENGPYWAECNVGATNPEEYGYYFWWGDTVGYTRSGGTLGDDGYSVVTWVSSTGKKK